ncbi:MAG TPA: frataxin domain-containing protein [Candidatus Megaira endosymbiont of Hartmannula sinica]|nr:frataxin domain-containing protein [Candidatus Megaera endosymbiont of Hartmannula sinica]
MLNYNPDNNDLKTNLFIIKTKLMQETEFIKLFLQIINHIADEVDIKSNYEYEIDITDESLSIETKQGIFLINRQIILKEIWLSSPISGPHHFTYKNISNNEQDNFQWVNKNNINIFSILRSEIKLPIDNIQ